MALNQKLTPLIAGRTIESTSWKDNLLSVSFSDGSVLVIKTSTMVSVDGLRGHTIRSVRQRGTMMNLDFTDGNPATIRLAEATSSVMLRDRTGMLEYVD